MSNAVSALQGKRFDGPVVVADTGLRGMITLRGDLAGAALRGICTDLTGCAFPSRRRAEVTGDKVTGDEVTGDRGLLWMSPDEVLILLPYAAVSDALARIAQALAGQHHLAVNVSDARCVLRLQGPFAREVLAKLAPVELHADALGPGDLRRSRLGQIAAAFWMQGPDQFEVICFRSVGHYAFDLLVAAVQGGPVGHLVAESTTGG